jgi:hypothetical protein
MKFVEQPIFRTVICTVSDFDSIPGLGPYCKEYTRENPIKLVYNMLVSKGGYSHSLAQKTAIIDACKKALLDFNVEFQEYLNSGFFTDFNRRRHALRLFGEVADSGEQLTMNQFQHSVYARFCANKPGETETAYEEIKKLHKTISTSVVVDTHYASNSIALHKIFENVSNLIKDDTLLARKSDISTTSGIQYHYVNYTVKPTIVASIIAIFLGVFITACKTTYDTLWRQRLEGDSKLSHAIIDNTVVIFTGFLLLFINNRVSYYKRKCDDNKLESAVLQLGANVPAYKELLIQTGAKYQQSQIIHVSSHDPESVPLLGAIRRTVTHFRYGH